MEKPYSADEKTYTVLENGNGMIPPCPFSGPQCPKYGHCPFLIQAGFCLRRNNSCQPGVRLPEIAIPNDCASNVIMVTCEYN